jgi:hypothetical protein
MQAEKVIDLFRAAVIYEQNKFYFRWFVFTEFDCYSYIEYPKKTNTQTPFIIDSESPTGLAIDIEQIEYREMQYIGRNAYDKFKESFLNHVEYRETHKLPPVLFTDDIIKKFKQ